MDALNTQPAANGSRNMYEIWEPRSFSRYKTWLGDYEYDDMLSADAHSPSPFCSGAVRTCRAPGTVWSACWSSAIAPWCSWYSGKICTETKTILYCLVTHDISIGITWTSSGRPQLCYNRTGCPPPPNWTAPCSPPPRSRPAWCRRAADRPDSRWTPASSTPAESTRSHRGRRRPAGVPAAGWSDSGRFSTWSARAAVWWSCRCRSTRSRRPEWWSCSATGTLWRCGSCSARRPACEWLAIITEQRAEVFAGMTNLGELQTAQRLLLLEQVAQRRTDTDERRHRRKALDDAATKQMRTRNAMSVSDRLPGDVYIGFKRFSAARRKRD